MRGASLRIERHGIQTESSAPVGFAGGGPSKYAEAVAKLIPGEVVAAYLSGKAVLQADTPPPSVYWWIGWTVFCFAVVIGLRRWMTSDTANGVPAEWSAVCISALSFVVWVYSFGDVFQILGWWSRAGAALVLIGWTLGAPLLLFLFKRYFPGK